MKAAVFALLVAVCQGVQLGRSDQAQHSIYECYGLWKKRSKEQMEYCCKTTGKWCKAVVQQPVAFQAQYSVFQCYGVQQEKLTLGLKSFCCRTTNRWCTHHHGHRWGSINNWRKWSVLFRCYGARPSTAASMRYCCQTTKRWCDVPDTVSVTQVPAAPKAPKVPVTKTVTQVVTKPLLKPVAKPQKPVGPYSVFSCNGYWENPDKGQMEYCCKLTGRWCNGAKTDMDRLHHQTKPAAPKAPKAPVTKTVTPVITKPATKPVTATVTQVVTKPAVPKAPKAPVTPVITKPATKPAPVTKTMTQVVTKPLLKPIAKPEEPVGPYTVFSCNGYWENPDKGQMEYCCKLTGRWCNGAKTDMDRLHNGKKPAAPKAPKTEERRS